MLKNELTYLKNCGVLTYSNIFTPFFNNMNEGIIRISGEWNQCFQIWK